jgi:cholesterol transport system auxiliary component
MNTTAISGKTGGMMASIRWIASLLVLGASGCISLGGKAPAQMIGLTPAHSAAAGMTASGTLADAIVVLEPETDRRLSVLRVPVQVDDATIAYLKDASWVERPARLFRSLLAETIRSKGGRLVVEGAPGEAGGKVRLSGRLIDMGYDARSSSVVVRYDASREDAGGAVSVKRFESIVRGVQPKAEAVAPALNEAANAVAAQVADWVG